MLERSIRRSSELTPTVLVIRCRGGENHTQHHSKAYPPLTPYTPRHHASYAVNATSPNADRHDELIGSTRIVSTGSTSEAQTSVGRSAPARPLSCRWAFPARCAE